MTKPSKPKDTSDKPGAASKAIVNRPDASPPDTASQPGASSDSVKPDKDDDGVLESLGKAMSAPVLDAADENPDAKPER